MSRAEKRLSGFAGSVKNRFLLSIEIIISLPCVIIIAFGCASALPIGSRAASVAYTFDHSLSPNVVPAGVSASLLSGIDVVSFVEGNPVPSGGTVDTFGPSGTSFMEFTVTPNLGFALNLISFSFDERNYLDFGPTGFDVYSSVDRFTSPLIGGLLMSTAVNFSSHSASLAGASYQNLTTPFTMLLSGSGGPPRNLVRSTLLGWSIM